MRVAIRLLLAVAFGTMLAGCAARGAALAAAGGSDRHATPDAPTWAFVAREDLAAGPHHTRHDELFGKYVTGYNRYVLRGIDEVQAHAPDGGGYFIGVRANPPESPVGYQLRLFGAPLLDPPRTSSYCSGATYTAFIEALNMMYPDGAARLSPERAESLRMQEPDGGRREDTIKYWGKWNDDGWGSHYALVQYSGMGREVAPEQAQPGDFMNISWTNGGGHAVIFLGWIPPGEDGQMGIAFWSSQKNATNGYGDVYLENLERIRQVKIVRMTEPDKLFTFDVEAPVVRRIPGDVIVAAGAASE